MLGLTRPTRITSDWASAAVGAAMSGLRPVVEIMFMDFITLAMDALVNQAAKANFMFGGRFTVPMVLRTDCLKLDVLRNALVQARAAALIHTAAVAFKMPYGEIIPIEATPSN